MSGRRQQSATQSPETPSASTFADPAWPAPSTTNNRINTVKSRTSVKKNDGPIVYPLNVLSAVLGDRVIEPLYPSLYRFEILAPTPLDRLFVCERCYKYTVDARKIFAHTRFCEHANTIPGRVIYAKGRYSIYELDGEEFRLFAQNLSLFSKLFIETKSVCFDVTNFLFYLLVDAYPQNPASAAEVHNGPPQQKPQMVAFFSKEKLSWDNNNLACILVFPPWQKRGLGQLLVGVSYELSRMEGKLGGPERPLSAPGAYSYNIYWSQIIAQFLLDRPGNCQVAVSDISEATFMIPEDVIGTLTHMNVLALQESTGNNRKSSRDTDLAVQTTGLAIAGPAETPQGKENDLPAKLSKKLAKKAQGCVLVDREALKRWLTQYERRMSTSNDLHVDREAFVEGVLAYGVAALEEEVEEDNEDEEMED